MLDIIGDTHGNLTGLRNAGARLGYAIEDNWQHPDGRHLVFIGDLVDGGPESLGVSELVMRLCHEGRATCLMGNHEYNLLEAWDGIQAPRKSGKATFADAQSRRDRWEPVIDFFRALPLAIEMEELRLVHAVWDAGAFKLLDPVLRQSTTRDAFPADCDWWASPFAARGLKDALPTTTIPASDDRPHAVVIKGLEVVADGGSFKDAHNKTRTQLRECWWHACSREIPRDKTIVFGHYHHLPPIEADFTPHFSYGTREWASWTKERHERCERSGKAKVPSDATAICVDLDGGRHDDGWIGALRWPEREMVWARA